MRVPPMVSEFFGWRWAPCVGLTGGSLTFVALALLLIPKEFDAASGGSSLPNETALLDRAVAVPPRAMLGASLPRNFASMAGDTEQASPPSRREPSTRPPGVAEQAAPPQRGFSPIIDRPEPPPPPPPPPPAPVEVAPPQPPPSAPPPPNAVMQQPQQPDADGPRREVTVQ